MKNFPFHVIFHSILTHSNVKYIFIFSSYMEYFQSTFMDNASVIKKKKKNTNPTMQLMLSFFHLCIVLENLQKKPFNFSINSK